jgi:hypothetical protein
VIASFFDPDLGERFLLAGLLALLVAVLLVVSQLRKRAAARRQEPLVASSVDASEPAARAPDVVVVNDGTAGGSRP